MDILTNKKIESYDYNCRYAFTPYYLNTVDDREIYGIGTQISKDLPFVEYTIKQGDTLDELALQYYGNPTFWWVIAYFNDILDSFQDLIELPPKLRIPSISKVQFGGDR